MSIWSDRLGHRPAEDAARLPAVPVEALRPSRAHPVARVDGLGRDGAGDEVAGVARERRRAEPPGGIGRVGAAVKNTRRRRISA